METNSEANDMIGRKISTLIRGVMMMMTANYTGSCYQFMFPNLFVIR